MEDGEACVAGEGWVAGLDGGIGGGKCHPGGGEC